MTEILDLLGLDFIITIVNIIKSIINLISSFVKISWTLMEYVYDFNAVIGVLMVSAFAFGIIYGLLKAFNLIPFV